MGISSLHTFVTTKCARFITNTTLSGLDTVFVDGDAFVNWIGMNEFRRLPFANIADARERLKHTDGLFSSILDKLAAANKRVVFVFDVKGIYYELKEEKKQERKKQRALGKSLVLKFQRFSYENNNNYRVSRNEFFEYKNTDAVSFLNEEIKARLKLDIEPLAAIELHEACDEEADYELVRLHTQTPNSCILSKDTDFVVFPGVTDYRVLDDAFDASTLAVDRWNVEKIKAHICNMGVRGTPMLQSAFLYHMQLCQSDYIPHNGFVRTIRQAMPRKTNGTTWLEHTLTHYGRLTKPKIKAKLRALGITTSQLRRIDRAVNVYTHETPPKLAKGKVRLSGLEAQLEYLSVRNCNGHQLAPDVGKSITIQGNEGP
jgi:hypothetical protein